MAHFTTALQFEIPPLACDCHTHIYGDPDRFPLAPGRVYTPETVLPERMTEFHRTIGMERVVVVQPNTHGTDNSTTLYGMSVRGVNARGVALIDDRTTDQAIESMSQAGMRGARINLRLRHGDDGDVANGWRQFQAAVARLAKHGWHLQIFAGIRVVEGIADLVRDSPVPVVFDHFGGIEAVLGLEQPGFADLVDLVASGNVYVKLSAAYRCSSQAPDFPDVAPFARALIAANPDRILWGSDWPHPTGVTPPGRAVTDVTPMQQVDDVALLNQLAVWQPDPEMRKKILVDNPARLYGFEQ
jgi:predicted TIM-barrel fold metal-dependent hydrolase